MGSRINSNLDFILVTCLKNYSYISHFPCCRVFATSGDHVTPFRTRALDTSPHNRSPCFLRGNGPLAIKAGKCSRRGPMKMSNGNLALVLILLVSCSGADLATEFAETSEGGSASLPCNLEPVQPPDRVIMVLWYRLVNRYVGDWFGSIACRIRTMERPVFGVVIRWR